MAEGSRKKSSGARSPQTRAGLLTAKLLSLGIALVALALGGATELWEQAIILGLTGLLICIFPARRSSGVVSSLLLLSLALLAASAFLPASWSFSSEWRNQLGSELQIGLPSTRSPQPWLTLQACGLFSAGLIWAAYVLSFEWNRHERMILMSSLIAGVGILAALAVINYFATWHIPFWIQEQNRGWFPNRNQTADVLAICGILNYALLIDRVSKGQRSGYWWILSLAAITTALIVDTSRAGVLLFFCGVCLWHLWPTSGDGTARQLSRFRWTHLWFVHGRESLKWTALGFAFIFAMVTLFFLCGGKTADRFKNDGPRPSQGQVYDYRVAIQEDALRFSFDSPILGVGLGNFDAIFPIFRQASVGQNRAIHPESDWLWAACEMGWFAPMIFLGGILWWLTRVLPFRIEPGESLRRAVAAAAFMYVLHGFIDVSSHRVGSAFVALLLFSMAMRERAATRRILPPWRITPLIFRGLGLWLILVAAWWFASLEGQRVPPTTSTLTSLKNDVVQQVAKGNAQAIHQYADAGLRIAPLDWLLHFQRGYAEVYEPSSLLRAISDFQIARKLEPHWSELCIDEGATWLAVGDPDRCLDAWEAALRRAGDDAPHLYRWCIDASTTNAAVRAGLQEFAGDRFDWQLIFLKESTPDEMSKFVSDLLDRDPDLVKLSAEQRAQFFDSWWTRGDQPSLAQQLIAHPDWQPQGWRYLAQWYARDKNFEQACSILGSYGTAPTLPTLATSGTVADLERDFYSHPDLGTGLMLYKSEMDQGSTDDALSTIRTMEKMPEAPLYLSFLEAQLWAKKGQWELAWDAWNKYYQF